MSRPKIKTAADLIDQMQGEASWLLSHAQALADYGRDEEAAAEWARAAACTEQVACLLETEDQEREAAIQRVSAASCHEKLGQHARAVTLLHAALSSVLPDDYRARVEQQLTRCLAQAQRGMRLASARRARKPSSVAP
jgi:tetratricopeptide (TPR) repeat protein